MQAIEIAVYITMSVIVGGLILGFIIDWNVNETREAIANVVFQDDKTTDYKQVDRGDFVIALYDSWEDCGFGEINYTYAFYVKNTKEYEELSKEYIFKELKRLNWCSSLQSAEFTCGEGEDLEMDDDEIELPAVVGVECMDHKLIIST
jgi:hypothetical protein